MIGKIKGIGFMDHTIALFFKIGKREHILDLYENGTVYMNTLKYFREIEDENRGDPNEGAIDLTAARNGTFRVPWSDQDFKFIRARYGSFLQTGNLYCLYCMSSYGFPNPLEFKFDDRNIEFGSYCLMIKKPGVFLERLERALKKQNYRFKHGFVNYYQEKTRMKNLGPFDKPEKFEYQKEFRFFVENDRLEPIKVNIGSMKSYTEVHEAEGLKTLDVTVK